MPEVKPNRMIGKGGTKETKLSLTFNTRPYRAEQSSPHVSCLCQTSTKDLLTSLDAAGSSSGDRSMPGEERPTLGGEETRILFWRRRRLGREEAAVQQQQQRQSLRHRNTSQPL